MNLLAVKRSPLEIRRAQREVDVADKFGQPAVEQHTGQCSPQRIASLALDLAHAINEGIEGAKLTNPLGCGLLPHPWDRGQVVAGVSTQRRVVGVLGRGKAVLFLDRVGGHARKIAHALLGIQDGAVLIDELVGVAVAGDHEDVEPVGLGLGGQSGNDVVGLESFDLNVGNGEGVEDLADQGHLALELVRAGCSVGLVVGELRRSEGDAGDVECHRDVRGLLIAQAVDQHRGEPVDRIGGLAGARGEVLDGEGVERAICERVAVEQEKPGPCWRLVHTRILG
ncbi:unannotated protein [freshwater metagenome]|uniref:Unannotated protein n=1 Tax=freshwater metagenome TaxID=449393 RepID=A0A6J7C2W9_9ZZZZ